MKKRIVSLLLAVVMVLGTIPTVSATSHPFTDVHANAWYAQFVAYVYENGLMSGSSATKFEPNVTMTRAMTVTVLYRLAGAPACDASNPFTDVPSGKWYTDAVLWAVDQGITSGTSAATFSPNASVTREQMVTFLYRYAATLGKELESADLTHYSDYGTVANYARTPFAWAVQNGIISGTDAAHLSPRNSATRAQCATILTRFDQWVKDEAGTDQLPAETDPSHTHSYTSQVTKEATCTEDGVKTFTCSCGSSYTEAIAKTGHNYSSKVTAPTCTEKGYTTHTCSNCGNSYKDTETAALGHKWGDWKVTKEPTTEAEGQETRTCSTCGATENRKVDKLPAETEPDNEIDISGSHTSREVVNLINEYRATKGLPALTYLSSGEYAARVRAAELTVSYSHTRPDGSHNSTIIGDYGLWGECIGKGYSSASAVVNAWIASSSHEPSLSADYFTVAVAAYNGSYWVVLFG